MEVIATVTIVIGIVGVITHLFRGRNQPTWNPNGAPCFAWSLGLVLEGSTPKIEDVHRFQVLIVGVKNIFFFDFYEMFSGCGSLYKSFRSHGYVSQWYDKLQRGAVNDLSALGGLIVAILYVIHYVSGLEVYSMVGILVTGLSSCRPAHIGDIYALWGTQASPWSTLQIFW